MMTLEFRKKMTDSWFSYLQSQICKEFENLEKNKKKFQKRYWSKQKKIGRETKIVTKKILI